MRNNKGQSLIDIIFSIGIIVLVLTGVVVLIVSTAKVKRIAFERQKAVELSQLLIEDEIATVKNNFNPLPKDGEGSDINTEFSGYTYDVGYTCNVAITNCNAIFTVKWGNNQNLTVERLFTKQGI